jgi:hypothetical protein
MRSMYGPGQLLLASKKPKIINLVRSIKSMSIDEIKSLPEKPDVIRGLIEIKEFGDYGKGTVAELIADKMQTLHDPKSEQPKPIWQYQGDHYWVKTGKSELQISPTWYWQELDNLCIRISSNNISVNSATFIHLKTNSVYVKIGNYSELINLEKDRISNLI